MAIREPVPQIERNRERLLLLLARLLNESLSEVTETSNIPSGEVILSNEEKRELLNLLNDVSYDRRLFVSLEFVDGIAGLNALNETQLREIYLSERKRFGRTRAMASKQWADFLARLGRESGWSRWGVSTSRMSYDYFLEMEKRLFLALKFPKRVLEYLLSEVSAAKEKVELLVDGKGTPLRHGVMSGKTRDLIVRLKTEIEEGEYAKNFTTEQLAGLTIVLANGSVLFLTRDWSAAGTMSAIAGGCSQVVDRR